MEFGVKWDRFPEQGSQVGRNLHYKVSSPILSIIFENFWLRREGRRRTSGEEGKKEWLMTCNITKILLTNILLGCTHHSRTLFSPASLTRYYQGSGAERRRWLSASPWHKNCPFLRSPFRRGRGDSFPPPLTSFPQQGWDRLSFQSENNREPLPVIFV